ncbi:ArnT family glycosyltransferase [Antrihabitans spumae]|uniref:ArnT family glycosyltransferase n=1 Tax=Antrihabitans spumae TaxID=3373370 RepID=A0ABW7KU13_9NOCA
MDLSRVAWWPLALLSSSLAAFVLIFSGRYGPHRDELYFVTAGQHLAWGYVDQPAFTPLVARLVSTLFGDALVAWRLPSALAAGAVVLLTGLIARRLGGDRSAQLLAGSAMAVSAFLLIVGHMLSTATFDLLFWTLISFLVVRQLQGADPRGWLLVGLVTGIALHNKSLIAALIAALLLGLLAVGPRSVLRSGWLWAGAGIAALVWLPNLAWQASNGWPQLSLARAIADGSSGSSQPWWLFLPMQLVLISPVLVAMWVPGLVRMWRAVELRPVRCFAVAYVVLAVVFLVTGGKPYYLAGLFPVLLAAGAPLVVDWLRRRSDARAWVSGGLGLSLLFNAVLMLPVLPVRVLADTPVVDINYDAGETVGWPAFADTVAGVFAGVSRAEQIRTVVVTENYGQAGAIDRYGPERGLSKAYSGHNAYFDWGPPPDTAGPVVVIGFDEDFLRTVFADVSPAATIDNGVGVNNDEQGTPVWIARDPRGPWAAIWPSFRRLG